MESEQDTRNRQYSNSQAPGFMEAFLEDDLELDTTQQAILEGMLKGVGFEKKSKWNKIPINHDNSDLSRYFFVRDGVDMDYFELHNIDTDEVGMTYIPVPKLIYDEFIGLRRQWHDIPSSETMTANRGALGGCVTGLGLGAALVIAIPSFWTVVGGGASGAIVGRYIGRNMARRARKDFDELEAKRARIIPGLDIKYDLDAYKAVFEIK